MRYQTKKKLRQYIGTTLQLDYDDITDYETVVVDSKNKLSGVRFKYRGLIKMVKVDESDKEPTFEVIA